MKRFLKILVIIMGLVLYCTGCEAGESNKNTESKTKVLPHKEKEIRYDIIPEQPKFSEYVKKTNYKLKRDIRRWLLHLEQ